MFSKPEIKGQRFSETKCTFVVDAYIAMLSSRLTCSLILKIYHFLGAWGVPPLVLDIILLVSDPSLSRISAQL